MTLRQILHWKFLFYDLLIPALRRLSPARGDALLGSLGTLTDWFQPFGRSTLRDVIAASDASISAGWDVEATRRALAENRLRYLARDGLLDHLTDPSALDRFDFQGVEAVEAALAEGRGLIVVGSHFGAHLAAIHAIYRKHWPVRLLVQRPRHISKYLQDRFDETAPRPQSRFFVHRGLTTGEAAERVLLARSALQEGQIVYLNGDITWSGPNTRSGRLLGREHPFLTLWADLAMLTGAPVSFLFANHAPQGRYTIRFDSPLQITSGTEAEAFSLYLSRLESQIAEHPADAVPYLTWPSFRAEPGAR